jgi:hypothetical protein
MREEYDEAVEALEAAQRYANDLKPLPGENVSNDHMKQWVAARQLVDILQAEVNRLARALADRQ